MHPIIRAMELETLCRTIESAVMIDSLSDRPGLTAEESLMIHKTRRKDIRSAFRLAKKLKLDRIPNLEDK